MSAAVGDIEISTHKRLPRFTDRLPTNWETRVELEIVAGRALAMCVHPLAAFRSRSSKGRILVFIAYMVGSYGVVLGLLFAIT
jgi:hypothetical protein